MTGLVSEIYSVLSNAASREIIENPSDYAEAGILYCGICRQPKQFHLEISGKTELVPCLCKCEEEAYQQKQTEIAQSQRMMQIKALRVDGIQDTGMRNAKFEDAENSIYIQKCRKYVEKWKDIYNENAGLIFCGPVGNGKTFAAACIANALIDKGVPVLMTSFPRILNAGFDKSEIISQMRRYDLVIIDDLGAERQNEYALETVFFTIDERYKAGKPIIITTNLGLADLKNPPNTEYKRIYDRVLEMCVPMVFKDESRRSSKASEKASRIKAIMADITNTEG